jgi:hypothetical protein
MAPNVTLVGHIIMRLARRHAGILIIVVICFVTCVIFRLYNFNTFLIDDEYPNALSLGWVERDEHVRSQQKSKELLNVIYNDKPKPFVRIDRQVNRKIVTNLTEQTKPVKGKVEIDESSVLIERSKIGVPDPEYFKVFAKLTGENVIAMTLYGSELRYTMGAIRNAELALQNFPGWKLRIYTETPSENPRWGIVPQTVRDKLKSLGAELYFMEPYEDFVPPMMWRFLVADDTWVENFIVRDSDSRLRERDAEAVATWLQTGKPFMCIRDHPSHAAYAISGGLWGGKPARLREILRRSWRDMMKGVGKDYLQDMAFLNYVVWPKIQQHAYCMDSVSCDKWNGSYPFPVQRYGYEHVGEVVNEHDLGRPVDITILRKAGENLKCIPKLGSLKLL